MDAISVEFIKLKVYRSQKYYLLFVDISLISCLLGKVLFVCFFESKLKLKSHCTIATANANVIIELFNE